MRSSQHKSRQAFFSRSEAPSERFCWHMYQSTRDMTLHPPLALVALKRRCCDWIWWINQPASPNPLRAGCVSVDSPDRPSLPRARLHPSPAAGPFSNLPATCYCPPIWLRCLSSANLWQWAREHRTLRPSSVGSSRCHGWRPLPVPLRQKGATSFSRWRKCFSQRCMRTHQMRVRPPPLQMGQKL